MPDYSVFVDAYAGWGLLAVVLAAFWLRLRFGATSRQAPQPVAPWPPGWALGLLALLALAGFTVLLFGQLHHSAPWPSLQMLDQRGLELRSAAPHGVTALVLVITHLGGVITLSGVVLLVALWLAARGRWLTMAGWVLAAVGNGLLLREVKLWVARPRPEAPYIEVAGYSFPSGHSMSSLVIYGLLGLVLWTWAGQRVRRQDQRTWVQPARALAVLLLVLPWFIGVSRVWLGVHYASDVLAGWLLGLAWLAVLGLLAQPQRRAHHD